MNPISIVTNEDCMHMMARYPDKFFDLAIVDPPYGLGLDMVTGVDKKNRGARKNKQLSHTDKKWNDTIPGPEYFTELHRVSINQIIWGCNYYAQYIPAVGRVIHDKMMNIEDTGFKWSDADLASCSLQKRITIFRYTWAGSRQGNSVNWNNSGINGRIHPTQKPMQLYQWLLEKYAKPGNKILDTHLGSGSSRIAAFDMGFDFYGCEIDKEYFEASQKRFSGIAGQKTIF
jgi:site-specific DNA-methyltransferase (adenine-specific)